MQTESQIKEIVDKNYDVGHLINFQKIQKGASNTSFSVQTKFQGKTNQFLLRRYKDGTDLQEIEFEHALLNHLYKKGFSLTGQVIPTREGKTYVVQSRKKASIDSSEYYALFEFLPGNNRYEWDKPNCTDKELIHSAATLAYFHNTISGWKPATV